MMQDCAEFQSWDVSKRYGFCRSERICFRCLSGRHRGVTCRRFPGCTADGCGGSHHTLLHAERQDHRQQQRAISRDQLARWQNTVEIKEFRPSQKTSGVGGSGTPNRATNPSSSYKTATSEQEATPGKIAFQVVPVLVQHRDRSVVLNALLDSCSDAPFITKTAASELKFDGPEEVLQLSTVNGKEDVAVKTGALQLSSLHSAYEAEVNVHVIPSLDGASVRTNWNTMKSQWPHMKSVPFPRMSGDGVDMLIGLSAQTTLLFVPLKTVTGADFDPVAILTPLG